MRSILKIYAALMIFLFSCGCSRIYNPATGRNEIIFIDTQREVSIGRSLNAQVREKYKISSDPKMNARLNLLAKRLTPVTDRRDVMYHFGVIDDKTLNAFAIPGGFIYVNSGMMNASSDDELAGVLAHEIGHVAAKHSVKKLQAALGYQVLMSLALSRTGTNATYISDASGVLYNIISLGYSREDERQADRLAVKYTQKAGFDPQAIITMFEKLSKSEDNRYNPQIFSSHPATLERIENVKKEIARQTENKVPDNPRMIQENAK